MAWIKTGIIRDLDTIACIASVKSYISCNDTYIVSCLHFSARQNKFIDNNDGLAINPNPNPNPNPYFTTCV